MHELSNEMLVQNHIERVFSDGGSLKAKHLDKICPALVGGDEMAVNRTLTRPEGRETHCASNSFYENLNCDHFRKRRGFQNMAHPEEIDFPLAFGKLFYLLYKM